MYIAIDFDGTLVDHRYPDIGAEVPYAFDYLKQFKEKGAKLILLTMRSGDSLDQAVEFCKSKGIEFDHINCNPSQDSWTTSRKVYANLYIDDAALGCPLKDSPRYGSRPMVDWSIIGPMVLEILNKKSRR